MVIGHVINNTGRAKHAFKRNVQPGMKIPLKSLYKHYKYKYQGEFDAAFLDWLDKNKISKMDGFEIVVKDIDEPEKDQPVNTPEKSKPKEKKLPIPGNLTAREIADLKMKDKPKKILQGVMSIHKLRRALTACKNRPGKETLSKLIKERITELT